MSFVHLHTHSEYTISSSLIRVNELAKKVREMGMPAVAVTDWNNLYGVLHFLKAAKDPDYGNGQVKPIFGMEVGIQVENAGPMLRHMVLLAKDQEGFRNLRTLATKAHIDFGWDGTAMRPHLPLNVVLEHRAGLIALTAGLKGILNSFIVQDQEKVALETFEKLKVFGPENLYLELQDNGLTAQRRCNEVLTDWSKKHGFGLVATADVHALSREDAFAQEIWMMVERKTTLEENPRSALVSQEFFLRSPEEMRESFSHLPEACDNTLAIAERCNVKLSFKDESGKRIYYLPDFNPKGKDAELEQFAEECRKGLENRLSQLPKVDDALKKAYAGRLDYEIGIIGQMGFAGYYLIVSDFIRWAKSKGIPVGPGRGSGAGSLCAYVLDITDLDPMEHGLLFERFLNPERVSLPDFDVDFCQERRAEVIQYVAEKYGRERVCQIVTFGGEKSKAAVKDVGRVLGLTFAETNRITKLIPVVLGRPYTIPEAIEEVQELRDLVEADPKVKQVIELGTKVEGALRQPGVHAAGVIIAGQPLEQLAPLSRDVNGNLITQWDMKSAEEAGLVKFDFLGLVTLDLMDLACKIVNGRAAGYAPERAGAGCPAPDKLDYANIPTHDPRSYEVIAKGDTLGVFQLESGGMQNLCKRIRPDRFADISAINSLFRPGPLESGMVDDYINRKHGKAKVEVMFPEMEPVLRETYGVIIYQEQVQNIAKEVAGYSLGGADLLRRAMGKKDPKAMAVERAKFVDGCVKKGKPAAKAGELFDLIEKFAGYGFNKSHAAAYAKLAVQTAYLKAVYPTEFFTALLTIWQHDTESLSRYIQDARSRGIQVLPPDVNASNLDFTVVEEGVIRFGLKAVKNVGEGAVQAILAAREEKGPFKDLFDFLGRVDVKKMNKRTVECLTQAGAFDGVEGEGKERAELRGRYLVTLERAMEWAVKTAEQKAEGQFSLFALDAGTGDGPVLAPPAYITADVPGRFPTERETLEWEKTLIGVYISGSPLDRYVDRAKQAGCVPIYSLAEAAPDTVVTIAAIVAECREHKIKRGRSAGRSMGILRLEDSGGQIEMVSFPDHFAAFEKLLKSREPLIIRADLEFEEEKPRLICGKDVVNGCVAVEELAAIEEKWPKRVDMEVLLDRLEGAMSPDLLYSELAYVLKKYPGPVPVTLSIRKGGNFTTKVELGPGYRVQPAKSLIEELGQVLAIPGCLRVEAFYG